MSQLEQKVYESTYLIAKDLRQNQALLRATDTDVARLIVLYDAKLLNEVRDYQSERFYD